MSSYAVFDKTLSNIEFNFNVGIGTGLALSKLHVQGNEYISGNLGVGTTTPIAPLHIVGTTYAQGNVGVGTTIASFPLHVEATNTTNSVFIKQSGTLGNALRVDTALAGGASLIVDRMGNVGIGTSIANAPLHVQGNSLYTGNLNPTACNVYDLGSANFRWRDLFLSGNTIDLGGMKLQKSETTGGLQVVSETNQPVDTSTRNMFATGNVGIGTTITNARVHVYHTGVGDILRVDDEIAPDNTPFVINQDGNVGVGTNNPTQKLHVTGTVIATGVSLSNLTSELTNINVSGKTLSNVASLNVTGNITTFGTVTASNLSIIGDFVTMNTMTSNTEQMVVTNAGTGPALKVTQTGAYPIAEFYDGDDTSVPSLYIANNGLLGIGTSVPLARAHIYYTGTGDMFRVDDEASPDTTPFVIAENGNVGIGSSVPIANMDIVGSVNAPLYITEYNNISGAGVSIRLRKANGTAAVPLAINSGDALVSFRIFGHNGTEFSPSGPVALIEARSEGNFTALSNPTYITFGTTPVNTIVQNERMRITSNGSVGIGMTNPTHKLDVNGSCAIRYGNAFVIPDSTGNFGAGSGSYIYNGDQTLRFEMRNTFDGRIAFQTGASERMRITESGFIGVGTTVPLKQFHVHETGSVSCRILSIATDNTQFADFSAKTSTAAATATRVGTLGTAFPTDGGFVANGGFLDTESTLSGGLSIASRHTTGGIIRFYTGGHATTNERMRIDINGNIGIGTASPVGQLQVLNGAGVQSTQQYGLINPNNTSQGTHRINIQYYETTGSAVYWKIASGVPSGFGYLLVINGDISRVNQARYIRNFYFNTSGTVNIFKVNGHLDTDGAVSSAASTVQVWRNTSNNTVDIYVVIDSYSHVNFTLEVSNIMIPLLARTVSNVTAPVASGTYILYYDLNNHATLTTTYAATAATSGSVGIGITNPTTKLHVVGSTRLQSGENGENQLALSGTTYMYAYAYNDTTPKYVRLGGYNNSIATGVNLVINDAGGYVGIGAQPSNILQVGAGGRLRIANSDSDYSLIGTANSDGSTNTRVVLSGNTRASGYAGQIDYVATSTGSHVWSTNNTSEKMRLLTDGKLGIGITNPSAPLVVYTADSQDANATVSFTKGSRQLSFYQNLGNGSYNGITNAGDQGIIFHNGAVNTGNLVIGPWADVSAGIRITNTGNVGIGNVSTFKGKLHVEGNVNYTYTNFTYGYVNIGGAGVSANTTATVPCSIYASSRVIGVEFNAVSDRRIKNKIVDVVDTTIYDKLKQLNVYDYSHIDTIKYGTKTLTGFIGQELKELFPSLVTTSDDVIPDIMANAYDNLKNKFSIKTTTELQVGDKLKIFSSATISTKNQDKVTIVEIIAISKLESDCYSVTINTELDDAHLFVYGHIVDDFHTVEYSKMTPVLTSVVKTLQTKIESLEQIVERQQTLISLLMTKMNITEV